MNESLPGAASVPVSEEDPAKDTSHEAPAPEQAALAASDAEEGDEYDEDREDGDEDDEQRPRRQAPSSAAEPAPPPVSFEDVVSGEFDQQADAADAAPL